MRRPPLPTGEVQPTRRLSPVTYPTQVIRRLVRQEHGRTRTAAVVRLSERGSTVLLVGGPFVVGLGLTAPSAPVVVLGVGVVAAGLCLVTLGELLLPERLGWDVRLVEWMRRGRDDRTR